LSLGCATASRAAPDAGGEETIDASSARDAGSDPDAARIRDASRADAPTPIEHDDARTPSCRGCLDRFGDCQDGDAQAACGSGGGACRACTDDESCELGECIAMCSPSSCDGCCDGDVCIRDLDADACGSFGEACSLCVLGFVCGGDGDVRYCEVPSDALFDVAIGIVALPATDVDGDAWDATSDPDPYVRIRIASAEGQTRTWMDVDPSELPTWELEGPLVRAVSATDLIGGIEIAVFDEDVASDDAMFSCTFMPDETDLAFFTAGAHLACGAGEVSLLLSRTP
jgi:hypothetical protein